MNSLQEADGARAEQLGRLLREQRAEIEKGRQSQQSLETQLERTKIESEANRKREESRRREIESRYNKTVDKFHSMREQLKRKEIQQLNVSSGSISAPPNSPPHRSSSSSLPPQPPSHSGNPADTSVLATSSLSPFASTLSTLWQSPLKILRSFTGGSGNTENKPPAPSSSGSSLTKFVSYYLQHEYVGDMVLPMRRFQICERRGSKRDSVVWRAELSEPADSNAGKISSAVKRIELPTYIAAPKSAPAKLDSTAAVSAEAQSPSEADFDRNYAFYSKFREALILNSIDHPCANISHVLLALGVLLYHSGVQIL